MRCEQFTIRAGAFVNLNGSHRNHFAHQAAMDRWMEAAKLQATQIRAGHGALAAPVEIHAWVHRTTNRPSDAHNVTPTIKACIDGIVRAGIIPDDNDSIVKSLTIYRGDKEPQPTITLLIKEAAS